MHQLRGFKITTSRTLSFDLCTAGPPCDLCSSWPSLLWSHCLLSHIPPRPVSRTNWLSAASVVISSVVRGSSRSSPGQTDRLTVQHHHQPHHLRASHPQPLHHHQPHHDDLLAAPASLLSADHVGHSKACLASLNTVRKGILIVTNDSLH